MRRTRRTNRTGAGKEGGKRREEEEEEDWVPSNRMVPILVFRPSRLLGTASLPIALCSTPLLVFFGKIKINATSFDFDLLFSVFGLLVFYFPVGVLAFRN